ncbi:MAG TPA: radical SAM protein [Pyrinomonadaceae bacterium]|jgi:radical SAM protein with 4Fe4S-binding SPASM domain
MRELPKFLQIEPVGQCNLKCRMCAIQYREDGAKGALAFIKFEDFARLVEEFPALEELHLQGLGEPLMHPRFFEMVAFAAARGIRVSTNSNLTLFTARRAAACVESGLDTVHVSLDGATKETYEFIRVGANFERVLENLALLRKTKRAMRSESPRVRLVFVLMRRNLDELAALVALAHRLGVGEIFAQHLCHDFQESTLPAKYRPMRDFVEEQTLLNENLEHIERCFSAARAAAHEFGVDLRLPNARPTAHAAEKRGRARCDWAWRGMYFSFDGQSMPCCMISTPDRFNFGNALEKGARNLWTGADYENFRGQLESDEPPEICRSCAIFHQTF